MTEVVSSSAPDSPSGARKRASARLGLTLRNILIAPRAGFEGALRTLHRTERVGARPANGVLLTFAALGGASLMLLYLKMRVLLDLRAVSPDEYSGSYLVAALAVGALLGLVEVSL